MSVNAGIKRAVERLLIGTGISGLSRAGVRDRGLVLAYHNIVPDGAPTMGDVPLHLPRARFSAQLDELCRHAEVVPVDDLFAPSASGRPRVAITFDDAYRGAVTLGVTELAERDLPATIFVAPGLLPSRTFWWDALANGQRGLAEHVRRHALEQLGGRGEAILAWAIQDARPLQDMPDHAKSASEEELIVAVERGTITIGSHTWSHASLSRLAATDVTTELCFSRDWLATRFGEAFIPWLSYPYGDFSPTAAEEAAQAGYRGALGIDGGWIPAGASAGFRIPRLNVASGLSGEGFALRIAGLFCQ